jgi:uncharacterized membrane protein
VWMTSVAAEPAMTLLTLPDLLAITFFLVSWLGYSFVLEWTAHGRTGLNAQMHGHRDGWMQQMLRRDMRMVDAQIMASLQNGTAFFASTSLIAVGGTLTILRSTDDLITIVSTLPFGVQTTRMLWEIKVIGLAVIFVYAFFKFAWSYRLYNYVAIMIGAMPPSSEKDDASAKRHALRTGKLCESAGRHFNRGQRAFFFALGYLGWFVSPWLLFATTAAIVVVMWNRQFASDASAAMTAE